MRDMSRKKCIEILPLDYGLGTFVVNGSGSPPVREAIFINIFIIM